MCGVGRLRPWSASFTSSGYTCLALFVLTTICHVLWIALYEIHVHLRDRPANIESPFSRGLGTEAFNARTLSAFTRCRMLSFAHSIESTGPPPTPYHVFLNTEILTLGLGCCRVRVGCSYPNRFTHFSVCMCPNAF